MRQVWTLILSGQILQCLCEGVSFEGTAEVEQIPSSNVYLVGSKWAITVAYPFQRYGGDLRNKDTFIRISNDTIAIEKVKINNDLTDIKNTSINLALIKLVRPAYGHQTVLLNPNYPEEGVTVSMTNRDHAAYHTATYEKCQEHFGYTVGVFCISDVTEGKNYWGKGIFHDGMLTGLTTDVAVEGLQLVTAIAPALRWITDTMSNIIYR